MADNDTNANIKNFCIVVAIDFGTSLSGFAYSDVKTPNNENPAIHHYQCWNNTGKYRDITKTATCILFDNNKKFVSFGYDAKLSFAEMKYSDQIQHYFFDNFKMELYNHKGSLNAMELNDIQRRRMLAKDVFTASIKAIKDQVLQRLGDTGKDAKVEEIRWVLTVPAIWPDKSKLFMKDCAEKAGIPLFQLLIALEPEAASLYCQHLKLIKPTSLKDGYKEPTTGTKYMVVDIGGGTTDITVHEKKDDGYLKELCPVHGNDVGGTTVDLVLLELFEKIVSTDLLRKLKREKPATYFDIYTELEEMKKSIHPDKIGRVSIKIPHSTLSQLLDKYSVRNLEDTIAYERRSTNIEVELRDDKLLLDVEEVKKILEKEILHIIVVIRDTVKKIADQLSYIILVGGFAENKYLLKKVKDAFHTIKIITPEKPGLAVLTGAVLFGQNPESISTRILRSTYGIAINKSFELGIHSESRKVINTWGHEVCIDCFHVIIQQNESVENGRTIPHKFYTCKPFQKSIDFKFYSATTDNPMYVDDDTCSLIGDVSMKIPNPSVDTLVFTAYFVFGGTTIKISIEDMSSGISVEEKINL